MVRPAKHSGLTPMDQQIETVFTRLLTQKPISKITVSEVIKEAGCNRTTFYYYFTDIYALAEKVIIDSIPANLPLIALRFLSGEAGSVSIDRESLADIERICTIIRHSDNTELTIVIENAIVDLWLSVFQIDKSKADMDVLYALEFLAGGIVSILSRYASPFREETLTACFRQINNLFAQTAVAYIQGNVNPE